MKNWICASCGQEVLAEKRPVFKWSDGHRCSFALQVPEVAPAAGPKLLAALTQLVTHEYPQLTVGCVDGTELHIEDDDETYIRLVVKNGKLWDGFDDKFEDAWEGGADEIFHQMQVLGYFDLC
jgi:hypothetical protein